MKHFRILGLILLSGCGSVQEPPALEPCQVSLILYQQLPPALTMVVPEPSGDKLEDLQAYRLALGRRQQRAEQVRYLVGMTHGQHPEIKADYYAFLNAEVEFARAKRIQTEIEIAAEEANTLDPRVKLQADRVGKLEGEARRAQGLYEAARKKCQ